MTNSFLQYAQEKDPRRGFACAYCDDAFRDALCGLVIFDTEIWGIHIRSGDMAQFRLQFWADVISQYPNSKPFDNASEALFLLLQTCTKDELLTYLDAHFTYLSDNNLGRMQVWQQYFTLSARICGHSNDCTNLSAQVVINAINGDFAQNQALINSINSAIAALPSTERAKYINDLLFLRLAKTGNTFNNVHNEPKRKLGLLAQYKLFTGRLFSKI